MTSGRTKIAGVVVAVASVVVFAGVAGAQGTGERPEQSPQAALKAQVREQDVLIEERMDDLSGVGAELEDTQTRVNGVRIRARQLQAQTQDLNRELAVHRATYEASKALYEEQALAAYQGDDLEGLAALLGRLLGGGDGSGAPADLRVAGVLLDGQENLEIYRDDRQTLRNTVRQLAQKRGAYNELLEQERVQAANLRRQEKRLGATIARIRTDKHEAEARLEELEARERERIRRSRSATGGSDTRSDERRTQRADDTQSDDGRIRRAGGGVSHSEDYTLRQTEIQIAQEEIFVRPVEPTSDEKYMTLYKKAAKEYGFARDWYILAAVGKVESNHGENMGPSSAGALGPMQFLPSTWETSGVDGNGDGEANIMDPKDAIPAAAGYLRVGGAPDDWYAALYSYNHADWYVKEVLAVAEGYRKLAEDDRIGPYL